MTEVVGTFLYRSPEQEAKGVQYDHKADMYALGIILCEIFRPFEFRMERAAVLKTLRGGRRGSRDGSVARCSNARSVSPTGKARRAKGRDKLLANVTPQRRA